MGRSTHDRSGSVLTLDDCISQEVAGLLQNGPGFVPSTGSVSRRDMEDVEVGIERMAYSLRWWNNAITYPDGSPSDTPDTFDSKIWHIKAHGFEQGPKLPKEEEFQLAKFKRDVMNAYRAARAPPSNMSQSDRTQLRKIHENKSVIIKKSDKSNKFVAMKMSTYLDKAEALLSDDSKFELVNLTIDDWEKETRNIIERICKTTLEKDLYQAILPGDNKFPEMYGLPKDHKAGVPLRPVVSACDSPVTNVSILLERILNQCLKFIPAHLENTVEALDSIRQHYPDLQAPPGTIAVTMDVVALYPSIPIVDGIEAVTRVLQQHVSDIDTFGLSILQIKELLSFVLRSNYFRFGSMTYHQREGVAMGSALLCRFIQHFNDGNPLIKFTHQSTEETGSIDFMDTTIHVSTTGAISYELFRKPCHSGLVADYKSAVPYQQKFSIASSEFLRASRLSSDNETRRRSEKKVIDVLKFNNFPQSVIDKARERAGRPTGPKQKKDFRTTLKLPFKTDHIHKKVQYLIRKYQLNTHIIYKNARLSSRVCRSALDKPLCRKFVDPQQPRRRGRPKSACVACTAGAVDCTRRNVVYHLECRCGDDYVGETGRSVATRSREHNDNARNEVRGKALGEHYRIFHADEPLSLGQTGFANVCVLATEPDRARRRIREAVKIRDMEPNINTSSGWDLL
ncbi:uncharacterized protein LOC135823546 [Sycon ciliatum]|uniref:uncharacterized protein LOC135823546 n=1 Tax=Sycon ciliatum TaxID=27933 RepID=UPI0031F63D4C